ncbi:MAG: hypothetical protein II821_03565 [Treponema sp.]|nr:hypothetical protein [Treponema sp.]
MTKDEFKGYVNKGMESAKQALDKGVAVSKVALDKAGKAATKFGDESILKIEIQQYKSQIKKDKAALGELAYKAFLEDNAQNLPINDGNVAELLESIKNSQEEIKIRKEKLEAGK